MPSHYNPILVGMGMENVTLKVFFSFEEAVTSVMKCNFWLTADSMYVKQVTSMALNTITKTNGHSTIKLEATSDHINNEMRTSM